MNTRPHMAAEERAPLLLPRSVSYLLQLIPPLTSAAAASPCGAVTIDHHVRRPVTLRVTWCQESKLHILQRLWMTVDCLRQPLNVSGVQSSYCHSIPNTHLKLSKFISCMHVKSTQHSCIKTHEKCACIAAAKCLYGVLQHNVLSDMGIVSLLEPGGVFVQDFFFYLASLYSCHKCKTLLFGFSQLRSASFFLV